jgi:tetratricopeptide (TPR) repeat protein
MGLVKAKLGDDMTRWHERTGPLTTVGRAACAAAVLAVATRSTPPAMAADPPPSTMPAATPPRTGAQEAAVTEAKRLTEQLQDLYGQGRFAEAIPVAIRIAEQTRLGNGAQSAEFALSLNNLGAVYAAAGDYPRAVELCDRALQLQRAVSGDRSTIYALGLHNLAALHSRMGDEAGALRLYQQVVNVDRVVLGDADPDFAQDLRRLADLYGRTRDYAHAEPLCREAVAVVRRSMGDRHPDYADVLWNLGAVTVAMGNLGRAAPMFRQVLDLDRQRFDAAAADQGEDAQMEAAQKVTGDAGDYLAASASASEPAADVYDHVLAVKGMVSLRQQQLRSAGAGDPAAAGVREELVAAARELSLRSRADAPPGPDGWAVVDQLSDRVARLQRALEARNVAYRRSRASAARTAGEVAAALPADAVLVDVREYKGPPDVQPKGEPFILETPRLAAFVVRRGLPICRVELGTSAASEAAVDAWRTTCGTGEAAEAAGRTLRGLVWQPLLASAGRQMSGANTVLFSPDGPLCRFPLAALPGSRPGTDLIDDVGVCAVAVPAALPDLLAPPPPAPAVPAARPSILLVGDVDYGHAAAGPATRPELLASAAERRAVRGGGGQTFGPLPQTRAELDAIAARFAARFPGGTVVRLRSDRATVAGAAAAHATWLHIATHGFFADRSKRSDIHRNALVLKNAIIYGNFQGAGAGPAERLTADDRVTGFHPGLLSGLALAGANAPTDADDGILTALEMEELDLSGVELAVLSACDTGLGQSAGGEGLLGLQRALQVAGARTVVASLWQVDDAATQRLMSRFYEDLWRGGPDGRPLGKLAALREAQRWLRSQAAAGGDGRGLEGAAVSRDAAANGGQLPPRYWAAFVLSGDWR